LLAIPNCLFWCALHFLRTLSMHFICSAGTALYGRRNCTIKYCCLK
jgi:hypothetical protein